MNFFQRIFIFIISLMVVTSLLVPVAQAAELYSGDRLDMDGQVPLTNAYVAANWLSITQPVTNDLTVAGLNVSINSRIEGGLLAAANELEVRGAVAGNARVAATRLTVDAQIGQDLLILAGQATIARGTVVEGDVLFSGGSLIIEGQVKGQVMTACNCQVTVNGPIGGFEGVRVGQLIFDSQAVVSGDVQYRSSSLATTVDGAQLKGSIESQPIFGNQPGQRPALTSGLLYGLLTSLVFCLVLLRFLPGLTYSVINQVERRLARTILTGLGFLIVLPILATVLVLPSLWLGLALWLLFGLLLITSFFMAQLTLGWWLLQWWYGRTGQPYVIDWRAAIVGCLATSVTLLAPVAGIILMTVFVVIALGGLGLSFLRLSR